MQTFAKNNSKIIIVFVFVFTAYCVKAQSWDVPVDMKEKTASFTFNTEAQKKGEETYIKTCVACHGNPGQANFNKTLNPNPPDIATDLVQNQKDGELFYKITVGKGLMPSFKNVLSDNERWNIVAYIRTFNKSYVQPPLSVAVDSTKMLAVRIFPEYDSLNNRIKIQLKAFEKEDTVILRNTEVVLFSQRVFGILPIDSTRRTDDNGLVVYNFPEDLPGDKDGNILFVVKINDEVYGEVQRDFSMKIGVPTDVPSLTEERAMWNVLSKAPIWLLASYISVVVVIWSFLIFIVLSIFKINKLGKQNS